MVRRQKRPSARRRGGSRRQAQPAAPPPREVAIDALGAQGDGVAECDDGPLFVPLTVPGDRLVARPESPRGQGWAARMETLLAAGPDRVDAPCPHFGDCGGCQMQHMADPAYRAFKRDLVTGALTRVGLSCPPGSSQIDPGGGLVSVPTASRRRITLAARRLAAGTVVGFNERGSSLIVDLTTCLIARPELAGLIDPLRHLLDQVLAPGQTLDIALAALDDGVDATLIGEVTVGLAMRERLAAFAERHDLARLSCRQRVGAWADPIAHRRPGRLTPGGVPVSPPPGGFLQASAKGEAAMIDLVMDALGPAARIADLFCGIGTFTLPLLADGRHVIAHDSDAEALAALDAAARGALLAPGLTSAQRNLLKDPLSAEELAGLDAVVFDPPRGGAKAQAEAMAACDVPVIVGVSCNPVTFARDAAILAQGGYRLEQVTPVDQFVWSTHVELVARFARDATA